MSFVALTEAESRMGQLSWIDPINKEKQVGGIVPMLFINDYISRNTDAMKSHKVTIKEFK